MVAEGDVKTGNEGPRGQGREDQGAGIRTEASDITRQEKGSSPVLGRQGKMVRRPRGRTFRGIKLVTGAVSFGGLPERDHLFQGRNRLGREREESTTGWAFSTSKRLSAESGNPLNFL